jgi:hypothetical protein
MTRKYWEQVRRSTTALWIREGPFRVDFGNSLTFIVEVCYAAASRHGVRRCSTPELAKSRHTAHVVHSFCNISLSPISATAEQGANMSFVYDKLDVAAAAALREKIPKTQTIYAPLYAQAIDREKDLTYVGLGGRGTLPPEQGEMPYFHLLFWKKLYVGFGSYEIAIPDAPRVGYP